MASPVEPKVWVFFYGSYINFDVLKEAGLVPSGWEVARLPGFDIRIAPRANLVRSDRDTVWGMNAMATRVELERLYTAHAKGVLVETYLPEAVLTTTADGKLRPAMTYISPHMIARPLKAPMWNGSQHPRKISASHPGIWSGSKASSDEFP